jgi:hypothetical protein
MNNFIFKFSFLFIFFSTNFNATAQWNKIYEDTLSGYYFYDINMFDDGIGYILAMNAAAKSCIYKTVDGGVNWDTTKFNKSIYAMHFVTKDTGFIGGVNSLFMRTFDGGNTWEQLPPSVFNPTLLWVKSLKFYDGRIGTASQNGLQYITYNSGTTWSKVQNSTNGFNIETIENNVYAGTSGSHFVVSNDTLNSINTVSLGIQASSTGIDINNDVIYISMLGQDGWLYSYNHFNFGIVSIGSLLNNNSIFDIYHFPELYSVDAIEKTTSNIFAGCILYMPSPAIQNEIYFLFSPNNGLNWYLQHTNETNGQINIGIRKIKCLNDSTCYGLGYKTLYRTNNTGGPLGQEVGVLYETTGIVNKKLNNNFLFPNPATQSISVSNIPANSKFKIINLQGITVMESNFDFEEEIDVSHLSNGVYFIQIHSGNNIRTAKFMKQ